MLSKRPHNRKAPRGRINRAACEHVQALENRQMLAAAPFLESTGRLVVFGTAGNDTIVISRNATSVLANVNGVSTAFNNNYVKNIRVDAQDGADVIRTNESTGLLAQPMYFLGGNGNDTIISTAGGDCLIGAYGNDVIIASTGANWIDAGPGADRVFSGLGNDTVMGAAVGDCDSRTGRYASPHPRPVADRVRCRCQPLRRQRAIRVHRRVPRVPVALCVDHR